ncbi:MULTISPECIES: lanthionine synthetase LanC family protein [unclassified Flavobacterium]|uniref:lanthionine synthetase LanC family protein n=1 Tax=unclassified Flavobacterium TaxID=196869 RepID=UPI00131D1A53|nr:MULTISPECIES: lanthionine synthetase LanC family protein [unclassified Flavobacterium]
MQNKILKIEKNIWDSFSKENRIGLYLGLSGFILFYDYLYEAYPVVEFENKLLAVIEKTNELIEEQQNSISLCSGVAGYGLTLLRLRNSSIDISEDYFVSIDAILLEDFEILCASNNFDFMHEAMGIAMYFIERYKSNKNIAITKILSIFAKNLILKINGDFKNILVKSDESRGDYYSFGLAHGVASYLNFLIYLKTHFTVLNADISKTLKVCVDFLVSYKNYDTKTKQYYANVISIETNKIIPSRLSWCQGDLGVSNALYNAGVFLDDTLLINEAISLMNHSATLSLEDSAVDDFGVCHGSAGILIQLYLASKKYKIDYSKEIDRWYEILKKQTCNFEEYLWFDNSSKQYIPETNLLVGSVGLGLTLLTIENKIDTKWLEVINLY